MAIYYVRKTGNDTTGNGSTGTPWLTIDKALQTVSAAGGHTINVGAGTYAENTSAGGTLNVNQSFALPVVVQSESGVATDVLIQGASSASTNTQFTGSANNVEFKNVTFTNRLTTNSHAVRFVAATNITFTNCRFIAAVGGTTVYGINFNQSGAGQTISTITLSGCTFDFTGTTGFIGIAFNLNAGSTCSVIAINNTSIRADSYGIYIPNAGTAPTNLTMASGGTVHSTGLYAARFDGLASLSVAGVTFQSDASYGLYFRACSGVVLTDVVSTSAGAAHGLYALTGGTGYTLTRCTLTAGAGTGFNMAGTALNPFATVSLTDVVASGASGAEFDATTDLHITRGSFTATAVHGLRIGTDGSTGEPVTGWVREARVSSPDHTLLIGGGTSAFEASGCHVIGGNYGIILKVGAGNIVRSNRVEGGVACAIYLKGAQGATVERNLCVVPDVSAGIYADIENISGTLAVNNVVTDNEIIVYGTGRAMNWTVAGTGAGNVCDRNRYDLRSGGILGTVLAASSLTRKAALLAAWSGYGTGTNDARSEIVTPVLGLLL